MVDHTIRMRNLLILQNELDYRSRKRLDEKTLTELGGAELLAFALDQQVPPRLRLSKGQWLWRAMKAKRIPTRVLLKELHEGWRKLGKPHSRGYVFPDIADVKRAIERCMTIAKDLRKLPTPEAMRDGEWERAVAVILKEH